MLRIYRMDADYSHYHTEYVRSATNFFVLHHNDVPDSDLEIEEAMDDLDEER
jgi:hypothetical protein